MYKDLKELVDINKLRDEAYKCAYEHGFHDTEHFDTHWLALIMSEVGEALNADRKDKHADYDIFIYWQDSTFNHCDDIYIKNFEDYIKDSVEDELADIAIRILDLAGLRDYDCSEYFEVKDIQMPNMDQFSTFCYFVYSTLTSTEDFVEDSLKNATSFIASYCKQIDLDLYTHILWKMKYNEMRPKLNGKAY